MNEKDTHGCFIIKSPVFFFPVPTYILTELENVSIVLLFGHQFILGKIKALATLFGVFSPYFGCI